MKSTQISVWEKAKALDDVAMCHKIRGFGDSPCDMVACDFRFHVQCMDRYLNQRLPSKERKAPVTKSPYDRLLKSLLWK